MTAKTTAALILRIIGLAMIVQAIFGYARLSLATGVSMPAATMSMLPFMIVGVCLIVFSKQLGSVVSAGL